MKSKNSKKPKKNTKTKFKKRPVEVMKKRHEPHKPIKEVSNRLDHSYQADVQRESSWSKVKNFFRIKPVNRQKTASDRFFFKLKNWWPLSKNSGRIFLIYLATVILGMLLLAIPGIVTNPRYEYDFLTSAFTTSSAFSDTGINIANVSADYSFWGQLIIVILIELGGIGIMTLKIVFYLSINRKISIKDTTLAQTERGSNNLNSAIILIRDGFLFLTVIQLISAAALFFLFYFITPGTVSDNMVWDPNAGALVNEDLLVKSPYQDFSLSLWYAIFHSTSAVNNAGFDILSGNSLQPYNVIGHHGYAIQTIFLIEWILGGLGYPTFHDIKRKVRARRTGETVRFSLFTKLNFIVYFTLFVIGPLAVFGTESVGRSSSLIFNYYSVQQDGTITITGAKPGGVVAMDIIFNSSSTRNAGFSTVNINNFNGGSKVIMGVLMFIGSAPSSTAGGIRTTTLAILILATVSITRDRDNVIAFKREIPNRTVKRAFAVFFLSILIVTLAVIIAFADSRSAIGSGHTGDASIVEAFLLFNSAFGTVGLNPFTPDQTYNLGVLTKIVLIFIMFLGQLGISNMLLIFVKSGAKRHYDYLEEDVVIG